MIHCQENNSLRLNWKATLNNLVIFPSVKTPTYFSTYFFIILYLPLISDFSQVYSLWRIIILKFSLCFLVVPLSNCAFPYPFSFLNSDDPFCILLDSGSECLGQALWHIEDRGRGSFHAFPFVRWHILPAYKGLSVLKVANYC